MADLSARYSNASPIYLLLFLSVTYFLNRPCVYCSFLLAILVLVLFNFQNNWFEPPQISTTSSEEIPDPNSATAVRDLLADSAQILVSAVNGTAGALVNAATGEAGRRARSRPSWISLGAFGDWIKNVLSKRELRIDCLNTILRL